MIRVGKDTKLTSKEVVARAVAFFGPDGLGLEVEESAPCCARFVGGGGYVSLQTTSEEEPSGVEVTVEGREWDSQVKQFLEKL
jgi:hypothetical protein